MKVTVDYKDLLNVAGKFRNLVAGMPNSVREVNDKAAERTLRDLRTAASGSPGPNVITGAYRAAMATTVDDDGFGFTADNPSPQAYRLEFGFVGRDSLGRHYDQAPRPHFRPVFERELPRYQADLQEAIGRYLK